MKKGPLIIFPGFYRESYLLNMEVGSLYTEKIILPTQSPRSAFKGSKSGNRLRAIALRGPQQDPWDLYIYFHVYHRNSSSV